MQAKVGRAGDGGTPTNADCQVGVVERGGWQETSRIACGIAHVTSNVSHT